MIFAAINQIAVGLNQYLRQIYGSSEEMVVISNLLEQDGSVAAHIDNKIVVCLTNIERDTMSQHTPMERSSGRTVVTQAPLHINLYLLLAAYSSGGNYPETLKYISHTLRYFQMNPVMDRVNTPDLDPAIDRLILDIENLNIQQLSNLWSILSSRYLPSVLYKVRMVTLDSDAVRSEVPGVKGAEPVVQGL